VSRKLLVLVGLLAPNLALSASSSWVNSGPGGAIVQAIAADPTDDGVVYVGTRDGGVFKSPGGATTWQVANTGLGDLNVRSIAVSPAGGGVVLAGTDAGLYRTATGGGTWTLASGPPAEPIDEIAFDRLSPATVYAVSFTGWIGKSTNGGESWQALGGPVSSQRPQAVHVDPTNGATVYVGTLDDGIYKSEDGGATWTPRNQGLTNLHVAAIAVDPTDPSHVYAGTDNGGAFRTADGGATWTAFSNGLGGTDVDAIVVNSAGRGYLANRAGVYAAIDDDLGWSLIGDINYGNALSLGPGDPGTLLVGYGQLPFTAGGVAFTTFSTVPLTFGPAPDDGLNAVTVSGIAVDPSNPNVILTCGATTGSLSPNGGGTWFPGYAPLLGLTLAFDPQAPGVLYEGVSEGVFKSTDGGQTWGLANTGLPRNLVRALLVLPDAAGHVLAGTAEGVYRTTDAGANWAPPGTVAPAVVHSLARNPAATNVWAGADDGVYRSTDGGVNWTRTGNAIGPVFALLDSAVAPKIFAGNAAGLLVSTDGGTTWTAVGGGLPASDVFALAEDPDRSAIYAGGAAGVFESLDGGSTWAPAAPGLTNPYVLSLAVAPNGTLFAGARSGSVFRRVETSADREPVKRSEGRGETREVGPRP
jgi:photosystem II stability/assembly factor-like uncharacterized protein